MLSTLRFLPALYSSYLTSIAGSTAAATVTVAFSAHAAGACSGAAWRAGSVRSTGRPSAVITPRAPGGHLHSNSGSANSRSIKRSHCIFGVALVLELDKSETWWVARHPDIPQGSILSECTFDFMLRSGRSQIADVDFALKVPFTIACHFTLCCFRLRRELG